MRPLKSLRLHARAIIRDGARAFVGSQSLRRPELNQRREVGAVITNRAGRSVSVPRVVGKIRRRGPVEIEDMKFLRSHTQHKMKPGESIADNLSKAGWSLGVSAIDSNGRTIWIADAHRDDGKALRCASG